MAKSKVLICGDSFAADWSKKYQQKSGWPNLLAQEYTVTNLAQAGCSEYRIYLQIISQDLSKYDALIVSHTSPYRIYVPNHPVHDRDPLHTNSDLIYTDIKEHSKNDVSLVPLVEYFEKWFDLKHARFMHGLLCEKIDAIIKSSGTPYLHITNLEWDDLYQFDRMVNFNWLFRTHPGTTNHYDDEGNRMIFQSVDLKLKDML